MTEEQKTRLREQPLPPLEEALAKERVVDRRHEGAPHQQKPESPPANSDKDDDSPGHLVDSYA